MLPNYKNLDIEHFQRLFDNKSESYKLFWFRAVVDTIMDGNDVASFDTLINLMIADAWYMVTEYHLNLGPKDTLEALIHYAQDLTGLKSGEKREKIVKTISALSEDKVLKKYKNTLTYNVPFRLQAPFIPQIKGIDGWAGSMSDVANRINSRSGLIYRFGVINGLKSTIVIDYDWADYIRTNYEIISGWIERDMISYLQRRNPDVPGISNKLFPPQERNLTKVKKYWRAIIEMTPVHEIYADTLMNTTDFSIDHFIPWSYVAHDELWNLSPTTRSINSSKSNNLPDWNSYFGRLSRLEYGAYKLATENTQIHNLLEICIKEHVNNCDIRDKLYYRDNLSMEQYMNTLEEIIRPVYIAAKNLGFQKWTVE